MAAAPKGMKPAAKGAPAEAAPADIASVGTGPSTDSVAGATESLPTGSAALGALREQLLLATQAFASAEQPLAKLLGGMIDDVARASAERLTIFPVCHHSPSSGLHLLRRLQTQPPKVLFIELCEDMAGILTKLTECRLPVALQAFARRIRDQFQFDPDATHIGTPLTEVLQTGRGVCQDFAHLMISAVRGMGLPARYVSGYLLTEPPPGQPRLVGADASHAWVSVWCDQAGWVDVDPTNGKLADQAFITLGWGRDYGDVAPLRGVVWGGGKQQLNVRVTVTPR